MNARQLFDTIKRIAGRGLDQIVSIQIVSGQSSFPTPIEYASGRNPNGIRKLLTAHSLALKVDAKARPFVPSLLGDRCPFAISRTVGSVIVDPVYRVGGGRSGAHVTQKSIEIVFPLRADRYPPAPIVGITAAVCIKAPCLHSYPNAILRGFASRLRQVVLGPIYPPAAAASCVSLSQIGAKADCLGPTLTSAEPHRLTATRGRFRHDSKTTEGLTRKINFFHPVTSSLYSVAEQAA